MAQVASNTERCFLRVSGNPLQVLKLIQWVVLLGEFVEILNLLIFFQNTFVFSRIQNQTFVSRCFKTLFANFENDSPINFVGRVF